MSVYTSKLGLICGVSLVTAVTTTQAMAAADLFIQDTNSDTGIEPYSGPGPVYLSPDIWVLNEPDPNYDPHPFPTAIPSWVPPAHQNPEYRDSKTGRPNYIYVRIHNRGDQPSLGTERLRLYQAKASTGLNWSSAWVDNVGSFCGADRLLGIEVTKPRKDAKDASNAERAAYRDALIAIASDPQYRYSDGVQYFNKQNSVHGSPNPEHGNPAFLPWHREMMNRYEQLLREANPLVTLLYWDFQQDPRVGNNIFTTGVNGFMGASNGTVGLPLTPLQPPTLSRDVAGSIHPSCTGFESDASILGNGNFSPLANQVEEVPNHDCAHGYIGGSSGQISSLGTAAQDPMFFLLHANVDRQWAKWQRTGADPDRIDRVAAYGADSGNLRINADMRPWDGSTGLTPWTGSLGYNKTAKHASIVFPPIYDDAPLNIPVLQPDESVIIEIPWFPPNKNDYDCAGQAGHFCLLARIETSTTSPFGMTFAEGVNVGTNTRNNNNIAWKNLTIVDNFRDAGLLRLVSGTIIRNFFDRRAIFRIELNDRTEKRRFLLSEFADLILALPPGFAERIVGGEMNDLKFVDQRGEKRTLLQITGKRPSFTLMMKPQETFTTQFIVNLREKEPPKALLVEPFHFDIEQHIDLPEAFFACNDQTMPIGGVRFSLDFATALAKLDKPDRPAFTGSQDFTAFPLQPRLTTTTIARPQLRTSEKAATPLGGQLLSPGEPLRINVGEASPAVAAKTLRKLMLEVDGVEIKAAGNSAGMSETISFDKPGVHTIVTRGIGEDGEVIQQRTRVLVSDNIPPNAMITSPQNGDNVKLGEAITVKVEVQPAFKRSVKEVALYVKEGDLITTGLNLVLSENYQAVARAEGPGPYEFRFQPQKPGMYMLQIGAVDDKGITGVSGHAMIHVHD